MDNQVIDDSSVVSKIITEVESLRILVVTSAPFIEVEQSEPVALQPYDFSEETSRLQEIFNETGISYTLLPHATIDKFHTALINGHFDVVHFNGHGDSKGQLLFETDLGALHAVPPRQFADLLADSGVQLVFLSACHSQVNAELAKFEIPTVVSIVSDARIHSKAATLFADKFYSALTQGRIFTAAFKAGKATVAADHEVGDKKIPKNGKLMSERFVLNCAKDISLVENIGNAETPNVEVFGASTNLPLPKTGDPFIGRELEIYKINGDLGKHQVINIFGEPGAGKSSLAAATAHWQLNRHLFPNGVIWHSVEYDCTLAGLVTVVNNVLGYEKSPLSAQAINTEFSSKKMLLIIDNFETVLDKADTSDQNALELLDFLAGLTGDSRIITTSRRRETGLTGEIPLKLAGLSPENAMLLFWEIADRLGWKPDKETDLRGDIDKICGLLGYLPLLIRLVAPLVAKEHRSLDEVYDQLCEKGRLLSSLVSNARGLPERLRDYRASLLLSYEALSLPAKRILAAMSVFAGDADEKGLEAVLESVEPNHRQILADIEDRSLVRFQREPVSRWFLPPVVADLASDEIANNELTLGQESLRLNHAQYYLTVATEYHAEYKRWPHLDSDWENIRLAFDHLISSNGDPSLILGYASALCHVIYIRKPPQRRDWIKAALTAAQNQNDQLRIAQFSNDLGLLLDARGDYDTALTLFEKSAEISKKLGILVGLAACYINIGAIHRGRGDSDTALTWYENALEIQEKQGDLAGLATCSSHIGMVYHTRGDYATALTWFEKGGKIQEELGDLANLATSYNNIGLVYDARGDYDTALTWFEKSFKIKEELGDLAGLAASCNNIGMIHKARGDYDTALTWFEKGVKIQEELGDLDGVGAIYNNIGLIHHVRGDHNMALTWYEKSFKIKEELGDLAGLAASHTNIGMIHNSRGDHDTALTWVEKSVEIHEELGDLAGLASNYYSLGAILLGQEKPEEATAMFLNSRRMFSQLGATQHLEDLGDWLSYCLEKLGEEKFNAILDEQANTKSTR